MVGISLEACDCRLQIGFFDDGIFTWYTFGGTDSWMGLALFVSAISAMDILTTTDTCETFGSGFCAWHFNWFMIL